MAEEKEKRDNARFAAVVMLVIFMFSAVGVFSGWHLAKGAWRREAVEKGHAEWYVEDHDKEWRWKSVPSAAETE